MAIDETAIAKRYPQFAYLVNHPEIGALLRKAESGEIPADEFQLRLSQTNWWKNTAASTRGWETIRNYDPETAEERLRFREAEIWDMVHSLGAGTQLGVPEVQKIAEESLRLGLEGPQLQDRIVGQIRYSDKIGTTPGSIATSMASLRALSSQYMVRTSDEVLFDFSRKVAAGEIDAKDVEVHFREQAKGKFPNLAEYIDRGITPENFFGQHRAEIAKALEISEAQVDFMNDPKWSQVLDHTDEKGVRGPMTISETQRYVRGLKEWEGTRQGQEAVAASADVFMKTFGRSAA